MKKIIALVVFGVFIAMIAACAPAATPAPTAVPAPTLAPAQPTAVPATQAPAAKKLSVAMVTDQNGLGDQGFNDTTWAGIQRAGKDFGAETKIIESTEQAQYVPNLTSLAKANTDLIVGVGFLLVDGMQQVAVANPNAKFALVDAAVEAPNVAGLTFREQEGSFLGGMVAGLTTKSNNIGVVGGMEIPPVVRWISGFQAGVKAVNPNAKVSVAYAGSFGDPAKGKEIASTQLSQGADVIFEVAGGTGIGAWQAVKEKGAGVYAMGTDTCKFKLAPDNALPDVTKRVDNAVYEAIKTVNDGSFKGGAVALGLKEGGMGLCDETFAKLPAEVKARVEKAKAMIIAGSIVPPTTTEELGKFTAPEIK